ncbi:MAG: M24 family metallopeptidase, partial [bacterium]
MRGHLVDAAELEGRVEGLQWRMKEEGVEGALLFQRADLVYYSGAVFQGALLLPARGEGRLFVWKAAGRLGEACPFSHTLVKGLGRLPGALLEAAPGWGVVGFEEDTVPVGWWRHGALAVWPDAEWRDIAPLIREQRSVKSVTELEHVRASGAALSAGFQALPGLIEEGIPEYEVQARMDVVMRRAGDQAGGRVRGFNGEARGVVAWGPSAAVDAPFDGPIGQPGRNPFAPMGAGDAPLEPGLPIIVDHTAGVNGYMTDMTRTFSLGPLESRFHEAHHFCVGLMEERVRRFGPGAIPAEI